MFDISGSELVSFEGSDTVVSVPVGVTRIGDDAFFECSHIAEIILPEGVVEIGARAFWGCEALERIELPATLRRVGDNAFRSCGALREITFPEGVTEVGEAVMRGCSQLEKVSLPESLKSLGMSMFADCYNLVQITLPTALESIGASCFHWCLNLTGIDIPQGVRVLENRTFSGCSGLRRVGLPSGLCEIGDGCFEGCGRLMTLDVPQSVERIGAGAFYKCGVMDTGSEFIRLGRVLVGYNGGEDAVVPSGVEIIGEHAFAYDEKLKSVQLPEGVTAVEDYAFESCTALERVTLPQSLKRLGKGAFSQCAALAEVVLPSGLERIGADIFQGCTVQLAQDRYLLSYSGSEENVCVSEGVRVVADDAFARCTGVRSVTFPEGLLTVGDGALRWCRQLEKIQLPSTVIYIGDAAFASSRQPLVTIEGAQGYLGDNAFPAGAVLAVKICGRRVKVKLLRAVRSGDCAEQRLWEFAKEPCEKSFLQIGEREYMLACAAALFGCGGWYENYLRENIVAAVCYAAQQDIPTLERVLSFGLLGLEQLGECIDFTTKNKLVHQQVILMRYRHEQFDSAQSAAQRFEL